MIDYVNHRRGMRMPRTEEANQRIREAQRAKILEAAWTVFARKGRAMTMADGTDFAYVGTRTTGTNAGDYLITGPGWKGTVPQGMAQISSPNNSVLVISRVLVYNDSDLPTAYGHAKQIRLMPLSQRNQ
jgi:hypothetical protein